MSRPKILREHGTLTRYRQGCRCDECREAKNAATRAYRAAHPEKVTQYHRNYVKKHPEQVKKNRERAAARLRDLSEKTGVSQYELNGNKKRWEAAKSNPELIPDHVHGSINGYSNWGCRCVECRTAWSAYCQDVKERRAQRPIPERVHGTENGYGNYKCRCADCTAAWTKGSVARAKRRAAQKA